MACTCTRCGRKYKVDLNIPDSLWKRITILYVEDPLLCPLCISFLLEELNEYQSYRLIMAGEGEVRDDYG